MKNSHSNTNNIFMFTRKSYNEALSLLIFSRDYFNKKGKIDKMNLSMEESLVYTIAMSTITTQLTSVLGWLLTCRAVENGEVSMSELKSDDFRMPEYESHTDIDNSYFASLNGTVKELLIKSSNMYNRIKRLEKSMSKYLESEQVALGTTIKN